MAAYVSMRWARSWLPVFAGFAFLVAIAGLFVPFASAHKIEVNLDGLSCMFLHGGCHRMETEQPQPTVQTYYDLGGAGPVALLALLGCSELIGAWFYRARFPRARSVAALIGLCAFASWLRSVGPSESETFEPPLLLVGCAMVVLVRIAIIGLVRTRSDYAVAR